MPRTPTRRRITVAQAADRLSVSEKSIRRCIASGDLEAVRVGRKGSGSTPTTSIVSRSVSPPAVVSMTRRSWSKAAEAPLPDRRVTPVRFAAVADVAG